MSCPMVWNFNWRLMSSRLFKDAAMQAIPEPGKLILEVEANL